MNKARPETTLSALVFAAVVALGCALIISTTVYWLRPLQMEEGANDYIRALINAAGLNAVAGDATDHEISELYQQFEVQVLDLDSLAFTSEINPARFDHRLQFESGQRNSPRFMPIYLIRDGERIQTAVLPFYARGMWSGIHGFVALSDDLSTISGVSIYEHGETPGIGDRIQAAEWLKQWEGKRLYGKNDEYRFTISAIPENEAAQHAVDTITGATVTVSAVDAAMSRWFGNDGYAPILAEWRAEQDK